VNPDIQGRVLDPTPPYLVGREKIREFARVANQAERADPLIRARKTPDEARAILMANEAAVDEATFIDTAPAAKPIKPVDDFKTINLWNQINAMQAGSKK